MLYEVLLFASALLLGIAVTIWGLWLISCRASVVSSAESFFVWLITLLPFSLALYLFILAQSYKAG